MADKRQSFRFRFPWRKRGSQSQVEPDPRPVAKAQNPAQTTTNVPVERPPFRPAGRAPVKASPSQAQAPSRTEHPPPSPSRANEFRKPSGSTTETQIQDESSPPSPSPSPSPSHVASQVPKAASQVSSPQTQPQPTVRESSPLPSFSAQSPSPASQPEPNEAISQPNAEIIISETDAQNNTPRETTVQVHPALAEAETIASPEKVDHDTIGKDQKQLPESETRETTLQTHPALAEAEPIASPEKVDLDTIGEDQKQLPESETRETTLQTHPALAEAETIASPEKVDRDTIGGDQKKLPESETESKEDKEGKKVVQVLTKEEKTNDPGYKEPMQETVTQLHTAVTGSGEHSKGLVGVASQAEQRHKKQETLDRTETLATTSSGSKPIKTPKESDRSTSRMSIQTMVSSTGEQASPHKEIRDDAFKLHNLATGNQMLENPVSVITLTGENRGASMHLSSKPAKDEESVHIHRSYKSNPDDSLESTTDGEVNNKENIFKDETSREDQQKGACINSNVQSINNAIVFNSSVTERSPGVEAVFPQNPAESIKSNGKSEPLETHKAQFNKTPSETLTHESTVRRRCLRGLFLEPSDSDPDNPEKPRHHGCRYSCGGKRKDTEIGTL